MEHSFALSLVGIRMALFRVGILFHNWAACFREVRRQWPKLDFDPGEACWNWKAVGLVLVGEERTTGKDRRLMGSSSDREGCLMEGDDGPRMVDQVPGKKPRELSARGGRGIEAFDPIRAAAL